MFHGAFPAGSGASSCGLAKGGIQSSRWEVADLGWKRCNLLIDDLNIFKRLIEVL